ncbi:hypothetical protein CDAR_307601 [Caerostris darwini]|uniref:Uncharacterized protein n=1 Tax=Caerostris darwini TaxID=1538125 RepID=A0AAV4VFT4_9ARAC|nr:hypothetical protein CDAR_307601 [Caerostris darwini]
MRKSIFFILSSSFFVFVLLPDSLCRRRRSLPLLTWVHHLVHPLRGLGPFGKKELSILSPRKVALVLQPTCKSDGPIESIGQDGMFVYLCCEENECRCRHKLELEETEKIDCVFSLEIFYPYLSKLVFLKM